MADRQYLELLSKRLADEGKLIEAAWIGLRQATVPFDAPAVQLEEMRNAFMAGALHVFSIKMMILDPGDMETDFDMRRMSLIDAELREFAKELGLRMARTKGNA
jgi:hypothetical protein